MILDKILADKKAELARRKVIVSIEDLKRKLPESPPVRPLKPCLRRCGQVAIIAETKKKSPSKGVLCKGYDYIKIARDYELAGAAAISVLTEEKYFQGHPLHLAAVRKVVGIPVLRKDFIIEPYQVFESRALGADAVLLIMAILNAEQAAELMAIAADLDMACLVEVHTEQELAQAISVGADIIGINNRDLNSFETDLNSTFKLLELIDTATTTVVSESGIKSRSDILRLGEKGVHAALVGETLMRSADPGGKLEELTGFQSAGHGGVC